MATRTVRLDAEAEAALEEVRRSTGWPISEALKQGLRSLQERVRRQATAAPYAIYSELDIGGGGYAAGPAVESRRVVREVVARKRKR